jgi:hypothetical protein
MLFAYERRMQNKPAIEDDWDGEWWLDDDRDPAIDELIARMPNASPEEARQIAREIFQLGHKHGYEMCAMLFYY